jgi:hypothetical protein
MDQENTEEQDWQAIDPDEQRQEMLMDLLRRNDNHLSRQTSLGESQLVLLP